MTGSIPSQRAHPDRLASLIDVAIFLVIVAAADYGASRFIDEQSLWGGVVPLLTSLALAWGLLFRRGVSWRDTGLRRPRSLWALGVLTVVMVAVTYGVLSVVRPLLEGESNVERFAVLHGNLLLYLQVMFTVWFTGAFFEELIYRGFLMTRLMHVFGPGAVGLALANLVQAGIFGAIHWYQGPTGIVLTGTVGFMLGASYLLAGRNLWMPILVHGIINSISLTRIFLFGVSGGE